MRGRLAGLARLALDAVEALALLALGLAPHRGPVRPALPAPTTETSR